ncbi:MAG: pyridoxamine 5'-phosphate oxidase family protein [Thermoplasmata archaeon]|nr:pyridoxamine 5'-phosphate oxidase family protein [Thermoplasmata archaeon]
MGVAVVQGTLGNRRVRASLLRLLRENVLASFATVDARGRAHINTAYFAWSNDWNLFFYSYPDALHCRNLEGRPSMAVAVFDSHQRWGNPDRGVQMFGTGREAIGKWARVAWSAYSRRFPGAEKWRAQAERGEESFGLCPYRFRPVRAKILDERALGAGRFVEISIP